MHYSTRFDPKSFRASFVADRKAGLETVSAYEPGMPLSATLSSH